MPAAWYHTEVNKGSVNMGRLTNHLNESRERGYRLAHVYSHDGNSVFIFEWVGVSVQEQTQQPLNPG
jgi:hypothetical protein